MTNRLLGNTGIAVSQIGLGALEIGRNWAADVNADPTHLTRDQAARFLNETLDAGVNFIDTAPAYWYSEEFIGYGLKTRRDEYTLATKVGEHCDPDGSEFDYSYEATLRFIDRSLRKLQTDHIDLIQIHSASIEVLDKGDTLAAMQDARQAGKVLHIGMTGGVAECVHAIKVGGYETVQAPFNLLVPDALAELIPLATQTKTGFIVMRGLAGGKLTEKYKTLQDETLRKRIEQFDGLVAQSPDIISLAHLAIAFLMHQPAVSTAILGTRYAQTLTGNIALSNTPIPPEILAQATQIALSQQL